ncbi:Ribonuclease 3-like protein 2 [Linum grandiflorum]
MDDILLQEYRYRSSVAAAAQPPEFPEQWADSVYYSVEEILNYRFRDKGLLVEALTHSSSLTDAVNYQRLEFVGDAVLQLAFSHYLYLQKPPLDPGYLTLLRAANVSTEKLARVAIKHQLYKFVTRNSAALDDRIFRGILQPIVTVEDLKLQPQPITKLFQVCQKQGKQVSIKHWRDGMKNVASVFVDGRFVVSSSSDQKEISKLDACRRALDEMALGSKIADFGVSEGRSLSTQEPKQKLNEICCSKKWAKPCYSIEKEEGRPHEKVFVSAVEVKTQDGKLRIQGDAKSRVRDAETSAAYFMLHALRHKKLF